MSNLYQRRMSLAGLAVDGLSVGELRALVRKVLDTGIHGLCFSPYVEGQGPGDPVDEHQIRARLAVVRPFVNWIRTFSCTDGNELIPAIARSQGLKTLVGVWLGEDGAQNEAELDNAIRLARDGHVDILGVGNEVLLRGDLVEDELLEFIQRAKEAVPGVPVERHRSWSRRMTLALEALAAPVRAPGGGASREGVRNRGVERFG